MTKKKIGIAIPTYNRNTLLLKLLETIPINDAKIFISDNGSYTTKEIEQYHNQTKIIKHTNILSMFENWNSSLSIIDDCDFISITSDDDLYIKKNFNTIQEEINKYDADMFIFGHNIIDENSKIINSYCPDALEIFDPPDGFKKFMYGVNARMPSIFFKKSFLDEIGYFDDKKFTLTAADSELIQRAMLVGKVAFIPRVVASYRVWPGSLTDQKIASPHWMDEIDHWVNKIVDTAKNELAAEQYYSINWNSYKDEVYARNLLAGMTNNYRQKKYRSAVEHFEKMRGHKNSLLVTKLKLWRILAMCHLKVILSR